MSYPYIMYPNNNIYGYNPYPYAQYGSPTYGYGLQTNPISPEAEVDFVELAKVNGKASGLGEEAIGFVKGLLPSTGQVVKNGQVLTTYGEIPVQHRMTKAERNTIVPVLEALLKALKQNDLQEKDVGVLIERARELAKLLPNEFDTDGISFDF